MDLPSLSHQVHEIFLSFSSLSFFLSFSAFFFSSSPLLLFFFLLSSLFQVRVCCFLTFDTALSDVILISASQLGIKK